MWIEGTGGDIPPDDPGGGGAGGSSGGGTTTGVEFYTPDPQPIEDEVALDGCPIVIDSEINPKCHTPLTVDDIINLNASYQYLRDTAEVWADTVAQRQCLELFRGLELLRTRTEPYGVYRGIDSLAVLDPATGTLTEVHDAEAGQKNGRFHFDPPILAKAFTEFGRKNLLATALHETAHARGYADHGQSTDYGNFQYFKYTNVFGPNSCVAP